MRLRGGTRGPRRSVCNPIRNGPGTIRLASLRLSPNRLPATGELSATPGDTPDGVVPGQLAGLELRHRQYPRVEDRIR